MSGEVWFLALWEGWEIVEWGSAGGEGFQRRVDGRWVEFLPRSLAGLKAERGDI